MRSIKFISLLFLLLLSYSLFPQLKDTVAINKNLRLADKLLEQNTDSALIIIKQSAKASREKKYIYGYAKSNLQLVRYYLLKGLNDSSSYYTTDAIKYARITKDTALIINTYLLSSRALSSALQYNKALELCLQAQRFAESKKNIKYKIKIAHDLGYIHSNMDLHEKAISYYKEGLRLSQQEKDTFNFANISARLAGEFSLIKKFDTAMVYNKQSLKYFTLIKHKRGIGVSLVNLAENYNGLKQYDKAIETTLEAIKIRTELGDSYALTILKNNLASCYLKKKDYKKALEAAKEGEELCKQQNDIALQIDNYSSQYIIYYYLSNFEKAFDYAYRYINLKDSVNQSTNLASLTELQTRYETDQKEKEIKLLQLENKNAEERSKAESAKRNIILFSVIAITLTITAFSIILYKRFKESNSQKNIIAEQKQLVDFKNKEIIDSINYAKTIQEALIPDEKELKQTLSDAFVIFKPKDIVSGDFYWHSVVKNYHFVAVADCTGHGVPGAFMSMMGISFLNEIVNEREIFETDKILNLLREKVISSLNKDAGKDKRDGMDMIILRFDGNNQSIMFSGANNSVYHQSSEGLKEIKGDKFPVGLHHKELLDYQAQIINTKKGDRIFVTTDGYPDQFGGPKGKKFMYKAFEEILNSNKENRLSVLQETLTERFDTWKGDNEQIDDVTVIGIEV
ncbi:MAG: SpoIIE family protein phosphatase [Bacteroidetes bacterium]|nr:SpoIIE family protein phosphatase [Bacteroidota bacterium]